MSPTTPPPRPDQKPTHQPLPIHRPLLPPNLLHIARLERPASGLERQPHALGNPAHDPKRHVLRLLVAQRQRAYKPELLEQGLCRVRVDGVFGLGFGAVGGYEGGIAAADDGDVDVLGG